MVYNSQNKTKTQSIKDKLCLNRVKVKGENKNIWGIFYKKLRNGPYRLQGVIWSVRKTNKIRGVRLKGIKTTCVFNSGIYKNKDSKSFVNYHPFTSQRGTWSIILYHKLSTISCISTTPDFSVIWQFSIIGIYTS